jgi:hypothetical protein
LLWKVAESGDIVLPTPMALFASDKYSFDPIESSTEDMYKYVFSAEKLPITFSVAPSTVSENVKNASLFNRKKTNV